MWADYFDDFQDFTNVLDGFDATYDTSQSLRVIGGFAQAAWHDGRRISSGTSGVRIPPPRLKAMHPRLCKAESATIYFSFELGDFEAEAIPRRADFQVKVAGSLEGENCPVELEDHWRVDSHIFPKIEDANEPHPYFHFQRGGHAQDAFCDDRGYVPNSQMPDIDGLLWRGLMQSPGPRIPMAPHCPILAIDFAIGQHDGLVWHRLRGEPAYSTLIRRAQDRLWTPFFNALSRPSFRSLYMGPVFA
jgi:hypothetical protein